MISTPAEVRDYGNLPAKLSDALILPHLRLASRRLRSWVGDSVYDASETEVSNARASQGQNFDPATLSIQAQALLDAETYLCLSIGLPSWNTVMKDDAGMVQSGSVGQGSFTYLDPQSLKELQRDYLEKAELAAEGYIIRANLSPRLSPAYDDEGNAI